MVFYLQVGVDHDYSSECFDRFCSKAGAALRRIGVPGPEATAQRLPGNQRGPRQIADPARRPGIEIKRQRRLLESLDGPQVERHRSGNKLLKEVHRKGHRGLYQIFIGQLLRRPPEMKPVRHEEILAAGVILPVGLTRPAGRDGGTDQPLHLIAEARDGSPLAAGCLESELRHEARKRGTKLQLSLPSSDGLCRHPDENQAWIAAVWQTSSADIGDAECEIAVGTDVLCAELLTVRQSGLDQELGHEAERAGIDGTLGGNGLHDGQQGMWLPIGNGTFSRMR